MMMIVVDMSNITSLITSFLSLFCIPICLEQYPVSAVFFIPEGMLKIKFKAIRFMSQFMQENYFKMMQGKKYVCTFMVFVAHINPKNYNDS
jgi:hypothetical protein